jgi:hypothetical protein
MGLASAFGLLSARIRAALGILAGATTLALFVSSGRPLIRPIPFAPSSPSSRDFFASGTRLLDGRRIPVGGRRVWTVPSQSRPRARQRLA